MHPRERGLRAFSSGRPGRASVVVAIALALLGLAVWSVGPPVYWGVSERVREHSKAPKGGKKSADGRLIKKTADEHKILKVKEGTASDQDPSFGLSREFVETYAHNNSIIVTWANLHYLDFVVNWAHNLDLVNCSNYLVGAMDEELFHELKKRNINTFPMQSGQIKSDFGWGSGHFLQMGREKIRLILTFAKLGFDTWISDVDVVYMRSPIPLGFDYPSADVLVSSDHLSTTVPAGSMLERWPEAGSPMNIGIMLIRPSALPLIEAWEPALKTEPWDQSAFNYLVIQNMSERSQDPLLYHAFNSSVTVGILSTSMFASGHTFFVQRLPERQGVVPYALHATFQYSGTPGKRHRLRERHVWHDGPEYFEHAVGFVAAKNSVPDLLLDAVRNQERAISEESTQPHFDLVHYQIRQYRYLRVLSRALGGRSYVLPDFWCGSDRYWAPHDGTIPGVRMPLPFRCPADHVLNLEKMHNEMDRGYREYSFLDKPQATALLGSQLVVAVCSEGADPAEYARCEDGEKKAAVKSGVVALKAGRTLKQMETALAGVTEKYKLVYVDGDISELYKPTEEELRDLEKNLLIDADWWCCVEPPVMHVMYDPWFDLVPHTDRFGRVFPSSWKPIPGP